MTKITLEHIQQLAESPMVKKAIQESERDRERALDEQRKSDVETIARNRARIDREMPLLLEREKKARQATVEAERAYHAAHDSHGNVQVAILKLSNETDREIGAATARLRKSAPDEFEATIRWTWDQFDTVRRTGVTENAGTTGNPLLGTRRRHRVVTTHPSLVAYVAGLKHLREEAERLILVVVSRADLRAQLVELVNELPSITEQIVES